VRTGFAVVALFLVQALAADGQTLPSAPYGNNWRFLESEHFKVLYHNGCGALARRTAVTAEVAHRRLTRFLAWQPKGRTRIVILDNTDQPNAMALVFPRNTIVLHPSPPAGEPLNYVDWLYELLLHEYTHILQADMAAGFMGSLRSIFGRVVLPNALQPMNQLEGLAVYSESRFSSMGRNNSALTEGTLRSVALGGDWPGIDRAGAFNSRWPWDAPYLFGGKFTQHLADSFGESSLSKYNLEHAELILPFMQNRPARKVFGKSLPQLWGEWSRGAIEGYRAGADASPRTGLRRSLPATADGMYKSSLALSPDRKRIAYFANDGRSDPGIVVAELPGGAAKKVCRGYIDGGLAFGPDGGSVYFGQVDYGNDGREFSCDLFRLGIDGGGPVRLTRGFRARDPAPSPDGGQLYFTTTRLGAGALCRLDLADGAVDTVVGFGDSSVISCPAVSPDGRRLAFSAWTGDGYQDIYVLSLEDGRCLPIMQDQAQDIQPKWSADGGSLFFSSDRTGVWNVFRWDLGKSRLYQITDNIGGAFWPCPGDEGLWCLTLGSGGYDLSRANADTGVESQTAGCDGDYYVTGQAPEYSGPDLIYRFWSGMIPVAWLPAFFLDSQGLRPGAVFAGADDLMRHYYLASLAPGRDIGRWQYDLQYQCSALPVDVYARFSDFVEMHQTDVDGDFYERRIERTLDLTKSLASYRRRLVLGLGVRTRRMEEDGGRTAAGSPYWSGKLADVALSVAYGDSRRYRRSISQENGRAVALLARSYRKEMGSDAGQWWCQGEWREYLPTPFRNHVLMAALRTGAGRSDGTFVDGYRDDFRARGFDSGPCGRKKLKATVEGRVPLWLVERGFGTWPAFLHNVHAAPFLDAGWGGGSFGEMTWDGMQRSTGLEIRSDWTVFYAMGVQAGAGLSLTMDGRRDVKPYFSVATSLEMFDAKKVHK